MFSKFQARKCSFVFGKNGTSSSLIIVLLDSLLREKKKSIRIPLDGVPFMNPPMSKM